MKENRKNMILSRRQFIKTTGVTCTALLMSGSLPSLLKPAFAAELKEENINDVLKKYFGNRHIEVSHVDLRAPIIAENGAVVPIMITSDLPMETNNYVKKMYIFVDGNLNPYIASIDLTPANGKAAFELRIKMRKTSNVRAIVETNKGQLYGAIRSVKVTIGGCGG